MNRRNSLCILDLNPRRRFPVVDRKSRLHALCQAIGVPTPDLYAILAVHSALRHLPRLLEGRAEFVLKPNRGAGGRGILVIAARDGDAFLRHDGERMSCNAVRQHVSSIISGLYSLGGRPDQALIQQRVVADEVFARLSYQGTPDVRVVLYKHVPIMAMVRLATKQSGGRANLHQGAIGAGVDLASGTTTHAVLDNRAATRHPDTGASVVGVKVPGWSQILEMSCRISREVGLGYLGVDIIVDSRRGPLVLEANARPGLAIQIANGQGLITRFAEVDRGNANNV
jgi:alpha-L-glutamate ligase-like protein